MRKRMQLVQQATQNLLSIQGLYMRHLSYKMSNNKIKQLTPEEIAAHFLLPNTAQTTICNLAVMKCLKEQIKRLEKIVLTQVKLTTDFQRFNKVGNYASYCRCVSGARYSTVKRKVKPIPKMVINT